MLGFGDPDVGGAVQQTLQRDLGFGAGQRGARATVDAAAEGQVLAGVLAGRVEGIRVLEASWVAVGRTVSIA